MLLALLLGGLSLAAPPVKSSATFDAEIDAVERAVLDASAALDALDRCLVEDSCDGTEASTLDAELGAVDGAVEDLCRAGFGCGSAAKGSRRPAPPAPYTYPTLERVPGGGKGEKSAPLAAALRALAVGDDRERSVAFVGDVLDVVAAWAADGGTTHWDSFNGLIR
jgi:hypothetical protein